MGIEASAFARFVTTLLCFVLLRPGKRNSTFSVPHLTVFRLSKIYSPVVSWEVCGLKYVVKVIPGRTGLRPESNARIKLKRRRQ